MKHLLILLLAGSCRLAWAQTNAPMTNAPLTSALATNTPATNAPEQMIDITSDSCHYDGKTSRMIYLGHVVVTDLPKATLHCEQLTVDVPTAGGDPTNIVAETNVVVDYLDEKGQTNHVTADKAVYAYGVVNSVTNQTLTFTRFTPDNPMPKVVNPQFAATGEPLVYDLIAKQFSGGNFHMEFNIKSGAGTNASPFNILK
jgi:lipopolysaccharide export system protein LptA